MPHVVLESIAKPLLVMHALCAMALVGSAGHLGWESLRVLLGKPRNVRLGWLHSRIGFPLYTATFLLGTLVYPVFRVRVRHDHFDAEMPWATNLFDTKEMLAAFGLAAFAALFVMSFALKPSDPADAVMRTAAAGLGVIICGVTFFAAIVGLVLVTYRGV